MTTRFVFASLLAFGTALSAHAASPLVFRGDLQPAVVGPRGTSLDGIFRVDVTFTPSVPRLVSVRGYRVDSSNDPDRRFAAYCETAASVSLGTSEVRISSRDGSRLLGTQTQELIAQGESRSPDDGVCAPRWQGGSFGLIHRDFQEIDFSGVAGGANHLSIQLLVGAGIQVTAGGPQITGDYLVSGARWFARPAKPVAFDFGGHLSLYTPEEYRAMEEARSAPIDDRI